ncbi:MAG: GNAT family N-acetyltransferase [Proteobacteria bacterium]|nr:GNAT family N-acetyltransferase [Pseudomonadota bacterium]MBU1057271.1 GNAT family N-acetyltransferase [Pseudomonadota bacterium]
MVLNISTLGGEEGVEFVGLTYNRYKHLVKYEEANRHVFYSIGARIDEKPVGLALVEQVSPEIAELRSLFVLPRSRRQGIGGALLRSSEEEAVQRGCRKFLVLYQEQKSEKETMAHLLKANDYSPPEFSGLLCKSRDRGKILNAPFLKKSLLPPSCEIFLWKDLPQTERNFIINRQRQAPWYPEILSPFHNEAIIEHLNSLGLRYRGEIAGWVITHRISKKTIRYTTSFVREDLQQYGFTAPLLIEAIKIHMASPESFVATDASFIIPAQFSAMIAFARKRMLPYLEESLSLYKCTKELR